MGVSGPAAFVRKERLAGLRRFIFEYEGQGKPEQWCGCNCKQPEVEVDDRNTYVPLVNKCGLRVSTYEEQPASDGDRRDPDYDHASTSLRTKGIPLSGPQYEAAEQCTQYDNNASGPKPRGHRQSHRPVHTCKRRAMSPRNVRKWARAAERLSTGKWWKADDGVWVIAASHRCAAR